MKQIAISNALYGALWTRATEADKTEEDILRRLLNPSSPATAPVTAPTVPAPLPALGNHQPIGFFDPRSGLKFPEGFTVFRTYKGSDFRAEAKGGKWRLMGHPEPFGSLAAMSDHIGAKTENAWMGWRYTRPDGTSHLWMSCARVAPSNKGEKGRCLTSPFSSQPLRRGMWSRDPRPISCEARVSVQNLLPWFGSVKPPPVISMKGGTRVAVLYISE